MTTTTYTLNAPRAAAAGKLSTRIGRGFGWAVRAMQYARLVQFMSELSDEQLKSIGITRAEIARNARESIYGDR